MSFNKRPSAYADGRFRAGIPGICGMATAIVLTVCVSLIEYRLKELLELSDVIGQRFTAFENGAFEHPSVPWTILIIFISTGIVLALLDRRCLVKHREFFVSALLMPLKAKCNHSFFSRRITCEWPLAVLLAIIFFKPSLGRTSIGSLMNFAADGALVGPLLLTWNACNSIYESACSNAGTLSDDPRANEHRLTLTSLTLRPEILRKAVLLLFVAILATQLYLVAASWDSCQQLLGLSGQLVPY